MLLAALAATAIGARHVGAYAEATARQLFERRPYVEAVLAATPAPPAFDLRGALERRFGKTP